MIFGLRKTEFESVLEKKMKEKKEVTHKKFTKRNTIFIWSVPTRIVDPRLIAQTLRNLFVFLLFFTPASGSIDPPILWEKKKKRNIDENDKGSFLSHIMT